MTAAASVGTGRRYGVQRVCSAFDVPRSSFYARRGQASQSGPVTLLGSRGPKPHIPDAELLVTVLSFNLNPDGTLAGKPQVVSQSGITDGNRPQAGRHAELAVRAVELAAPFDLPAKYYNAWKRVSAFRFDRKLSQ